MMPSRIAHAAATGVVRVHNKPFAEATKYLVLVKALSHKAGATTIEAVWLQTYTVWGCMNMALPGSSTEGGKVGGAASKAVCNCLNQTDSAGCSIQPAVTV